MLDSVSIKVWRLLDNYYFLFLLYWIERSPDEFVERAEKGLEYEKLQRQRCSYNPWGVVHLDFPMTFGIRRDIWYHAFPYNS